MKKILCFELRALDMGQANSVGDGMRGKVSGGVALDRRRTKNPENRTNHSHAHQDVGAFSGILPAFVEWEVKRRHVYRDDEKFKDLL